MSVTVSSGTAYVKGFDIDLVGTTVVDVEKPRSVKTVDGALVPFAMGSLLKVNNVYGVPYINIGASSSGAQTTQANNYRTLQQKKGWCWYRGYSCKCFWTRN